MGLTKKVLNATTRPSRGWQEGEFLPVAFNGKGAAIVVGLTAGASIGASALAGHNTRSYGPMKYFDRPARMTSSFTSGAMDAMRRASNGDPQLMEAMYLDAMNTGSGLRGLRGPSLDNYGVDGSFIASLYNMGG